MKEPSERDWLAPFNDYWHKACADCGHEFSGPKRASWCHLCNEQRKAGLAPKPKIGGRKTGKTEMQTATHSEDGREVPEVVGSLIDGEFFHCVQNGPGNNPLMTVAQHERIVAAMAKSQGAEVFLDLAGEITRLRAELAAQPARQVGGGEREEFEAWAKVKYPTADRKDSLGGFARDLRKSALEGWNARAALAPAAVVMPEYERNHAGLIVESVHSPWNAALDAVARLNRRAIPEGLLEKLAHCTDPDCCIAHARGELRALLGEDK